MASSTSSRSLPDHRAALINGLKSSKVISNEVAKDLEENLANWADDQVLVDYLTSHLIATANDINKAYAVVFRVPFITLPKEVDRDILLMIPRSICETYKIVAYKIDSRKKILSIAAANPLRIKENQPGVLADFKKKSGLAFELAITSEEDFNAWMSHYPQSTTTQPAHKPEPAAIENESSAEKTATPPVKNPSTQFEHIDISLMTIPVELLQKVPLALASKFRFVVFAKQGEGLYAVAAQNPADSKVQEIFKYIEQHNHIHLKIYQSTAAGIDHGLARYDSGQKKADHEISLLHKDLQPQHLKKIPFVVAQRYRFVIFDFDSITAHYKVATEKVADSTLQKIWHYIEEHNHVTLDIYHTDAASIDYALSLYPQKKSVPSPEQAVSAKPVVAKPVSKPIDLPQKPVIPATSEVKNQPVKPEVGTAPPATPVSTDEDIHSAQKRDGIWSKLLHPFGGGGPDRETEERAALVAATPTPTVLPPKPVVVPQPVAAPAPVIVTQVQPVVVTQPAPAVAPIVLQHAPEAVIDANQASYNPVNAAVTPATSPNANLYKAVSEAAQPGVQKEQDEDDLGSLLDKDVTSAEELQKIVQDGFVPRIVAAIVSYAITLHASDVHIEAGVNDVRIRYRIDGMLEDIVHLPVEEQAAIASRIKILSKLKIDETRIPQDGRFDVVFKDRAVDLRVSSMPTVHGEKIVMRILDKSHGIMSLEDLGVQGRALDVILEAIKKPYGIVLSTGPTGSGKSTTLYAILNRISTPTVNVITLEDPVEYEINGVNQSQIKPKIGYTFAEGLRSVLRQDPNIVMVGEIRDAETASMATHAALTGHLVLSTLHTNDAPGALPRLMNMGIEPFLITSSINVVEAQRLVRKVCQNCKEPVELPPAVVSEIEQELAKIPANNPKDRARITQPMQFVHGKGCDKCQNGYRGRIGIYEALPMSDKIEELAIAKVSGNELQKQAILEGMITMKQDGLLKALAGQTTVDEVLRETSV